MIAVHGAVYLLQRAHTKDGPNSTTSVPADTLNDHSTASTLKRHITNRGGNVIWLFSVVRLEGVLALLALYVASFVGDAKTAHDLEGYTNVVRSRERLNLILCSVYVRFRLLSITYAC